MVLIAAAIAIEKATVLPPPKAAATLAAPVVTSIEDAFVARTVMVPAFKPSLWLVVCAYAKLELAMVLPVPAPAPEPAIESPPVALKATEPATTIASMSIVESAVKVKLPLESMSELMTAAWTSPIPRPSWSTPM